MSNVNTMIFLLSIIIAVMLILINSSLSKKKLMERESPSPFECGFDPKSSARLPFSLRFYLIAVIFLIFDVEITLILPMPIILNTNNMEVMPSIILFFILILLGGLFHEWNEGALAWSK